MKADAVYQTFMGTRASERTTMLFVVDSTDPTLPEYEALLLPVVVYPGDGDGMGEPLNVVSAEVAKRYDVVGFVGDDHRFRSKRWDVAIEAALEDGGIAYGDDLIRNDIPTQVFMSSDIVQALGWMCLPGAKHLYLDNTWSYLGRGAECLHFVPSVIIEHLHPTVGKGTMDEGYERVNHPDVYSHDGSLYTAWIDSGQAAKDIATVRTVLGLR